MIRVLVTGANGQLGKCIQNVAPNHKGLEFEFKTSMDMDITKTSMVAKIFEDSRYQFCINCAAYTNVENAEIEGDKAFSVNSEGVLNIAKACLKNNVTLVQISTDYVFDGEKQGSYTIADKPNPINKYGASKLMGEAYIQDLLRKYFIIRTSWLYSEYGKNFYMTILQLADTHGVIEITDEQTGCPTNANSLARYIIDLIVSESNKYGIYHFTDGVAMTWYGFAKKILADNHLEKKVKLVKAKNYRTFAKRPKNSVLL